ncbi:hypothetical protein QWY81_08790 [Polaribacter undariae]|uniref:Uncharacterized protein n=1 Tax=Polaribacter sejongensis TaxID=985043 RepID=A0AAJ1QXR4_9FLAO|nr:hypothetical protein [Polaribacter undariae]MDN3619546.1 hypothetical protein [Polaribacter undariae]UWD32339.1 hypothetical protein NQP51_01420 [Polaribacter undariae]
MKKYLVLIIILLSFGNMFSQSFNWTVDANGMYRNGTPFFLNGQSWAKATPFTDGQQTNSEALVKEKLSELSAIGVNTLRIYGSPDDSKWGNSYFENYANLIKWIEEWNVANPDGGNPNKAMHYMVQINPEDNISDLSDDLPTNDAASFARAISDTSHKGSVASLINTINTAAGTDGSKYLMGYLMYHELNVSSKYASWYNEIGAQGIEDFMNAAADAIHNTYAPGKLVSHTGDAKDSGNGISVNLYQELENLDSEDGNVFENFDLLGFNLYISTDAILKKNSYYKRIVHRRGISVNSNRGWYVGETGASYDRDANSSSVAAANYENHEGAANLEIMFHKTKELGNLIGFMLFTVQDNDTDLAISSVIKQRGHYDFYGDKKFLYYIYKDILIDQVSTNNRFHSTDDHEVGVTIEESTSNYSITFQFKNKTTSDKEFFWSIHGDQGSGNQRFSKLEEESYLMLNAGEQTSFTKTIVKPSSNVLFAVSASVIKEKTPDNQYFYGREHVFSDAISTVAGLNLNVNNFPLSIKDFSINHNQNLKSGLIIVTENNGFRTPEGSWEIILYSLKGSEMFRKKLHKSQILNWSELLPGISIHTLLAYKLKRN